MQHLLVTVFNDFVEVLGTFYDPASVVVVIVVVIVVVVVVVVIVVVVIIFVVFVVVIVGCVVQEVQMPGEPKILELLCVTEEVEVLSVE